MLGLIDSGNNFSRVHDLILITLCELHNKVKIARQGDYLVYVGSASRQIFWYSEEILSG